MTASSRYAHNLILGAIVGVLFLWIIIYLSLGRMPNLSWLKNEWEIFFVLCVISPILEEYVFRGIIYEAIGRRYCGSWPSNKFVSISIANSITTLLFVFAHIIARGPVAGALVIMPSIYLGLVRDRYGSIRICMAIHALWNISWFSLFAPV